MLLRLITESKPLDEVIFYNSGAEFRSIYTVRDYFLPLLKDNGIKYTELNPRRDFFYEMLEYPFTKRNGIEQHGRGWCGGPCRWGTREKLTAISKYFRSISDKNIVSYVGIAADEPLRLRRLTPDKIAPLAEWGMTEADALRYCHENNISWNENGVELYDVLDRVSCWCCCNKNLKELRAIFEYLPEYWERLKELQDRIGYPMKKYRTCYRDIGAIGDLHILEKQFLEWRNYDTCGNLCLLRTSGRI